MNPLRTVIVSPNRDAWSETFIRAHIERLPGEHLVLTDGFLPRRFEDGTEIMAIEGFAKFMRSVRLRFRSNWQREHLRAVTALVRVFAPQLVLAEYGPSGSAMLPVCRKLGLPLVVHFHGVDAFSTKLLKEQGNYEDLMQNAAAIVVVSREMERQVVSLGAPAERVHYNCYGIDVERFSTGTPVRSPAAFVAIGRFVEKKAPQLALAAFHKAWIQDNTLRLSMIGDGPLLEQCKEFVTDHGLHTAVEFTGVLPHEQVAERLRAARAFVQHSVVSGDNDHEGTPLAVLEAMATGIPVIATRHAGIPDVVEHGVHGLLCDEHDVEAMSANIVALAHDPGRAATMGAAGRANVEEHYTMRRSIEGLQRILERVVG
jgi:colanic acid/amylovoran biosynthesis glycosyltransferase